MSRPLSIPRAVLYGVVGVVGFSLLTRWLLWWLSGGQWNPSLATAARVCSGALSALWAVYLLHEVQQGRR